MKKLIIVKLVLILILVGLCEFWYIKYFSIKNDNSELQFEIKKARAEIDNYNLSIENIEKDVERYKEEKKAIIEEIDTWKTMEEKIKKAL